MSCAGSVNRAGQAIVGEVDDKPAVLAPLRAGEFSLHHTLCLHRSQPNQSRGRRIGLAISYVPTSVQHLGVKHKTPAMLVRGLDEYGHFDLEPAPNADQDEQARAAYARSYEGYRLAYAEQVSSRATEGPICVVGARRPSLRRMRHTPAVGPRTPPRI